MLVSQQHVSMSSGVNDGDLPSSFGSDWTWPILVVCCLLGMGAPNHWYYLTHLPDGHYLPDQRERENLTSIKETTLPDLREWFYLAPFPDSILSPNVSIKALKLKANDSIALKLKANDSKGLICLYLLTCPQPDLFNSIDLELSENISNEAPSILRSVSTGVWAYVVLYLCLSVQCVTCNTKAVNVELYLIRGLKTDPRK